MSAVPRRVLRWGVAGAALLMVAGGGAFWYASTKAASRASGDAVTVTLRDGRCEPNALSVPAGRTSFRIVNATDRAVEWEILDGVMVVEERENIAPGIAQTLGARLRAGEYAITCGLLSNPRGTLSVTPSATSADTERPALVAFIGPLAEYKVFLATQARELVKTATALDAAVKNDDAAEARRLYGAARRPWSMLAPVAARFADLDNSIDPVAAYLERREADPAFTGFHRIEYALFSSDDVAAAAPFTEKLVADVSILKDRLRTLRLTPGDMSAGARRTLAALADTRVATGEELYSGSDLANFEGEVAGVRKIVALLRPVAGQSAPNDAAEADKRGASLQSSLDALRGPGGFPRYDTIDVPMRRRLADEMQGFAQAIERMSDAAGLGAENAS